MRNALIAILLLSVSVTANAQRDKSQTWEWSFAALYQESKAMGGGGGSSLNLDGEVGFGFNIGYNWTDHFTVGVDLDFLRPDYQAVLVDDMVVPSRTTTINHELSQFNGRIKGTYNFGSGPFRPFVEAGLGWSYFDSNVADGPPQTGCYWHPWWGYICANFFSTFSDTMFTYGVGVGAKYQFVGDSFLKFSYNAWELDSSGGTGSENLTGFRLEYGWNF